MIQIINLVLNDERLRWKHTVLPKVALEMIQLITGFMAFDSVILKTKMPFKMWFLPIPSINFWFLALLRRGNDELRLEFRQFSILREITPIQIHGIKNQESWIRIRGEIEVWN